eukprot:386384_1
MSSMFLYCHAPHMMLTSILSYKIISLLIDERTEKKMKLMNSNTATISYRDIEMKCDDDDDVSTDSCTPSLSDHTTSSSYEISSQQSTSSSQSPDDTAKSHRSNATDQLLYDQKATMIENGYTPIREMCKTLQGCIWKVFHKKRACLAIIKITNKTLSAKHIGINHTSGQYFICNESIEQEIKMLHALNHNKSTPSGTSIPVHLWCYVIDVFEHVDTAMIRLYQVFEDAFNMFVVMEYGGDRLLDFINKVHHSLLHGKMLLSHWRVTAKRMMKQMIEFVDWLHNEQHVCHMDISLENLLIKDVKWEYDAARKVYRLAPTFQIKFIDFGLAEKFTNDDDLTKEISFESNKFVGKTKYECPSIYNQKTFDARKADIWSIGVCWFMICIGYNPWSAPDSKKDVAYNILVHQHRLSDVLAHWKRTDYLDEQGQDLFYSIFCDSIHRASAHKILTHPWLKNVNKKICLIVVE